MHANALTTALVASGLMLAACGTVDRRVETTGDFAVVTPSQLYSDQPVAEDYRIGEGDALNITVLQVAALSLTDVKVNPSGRIDYPLLGSISVSEKTAAELAEVLRSGLADRYLQNPRVSVQVTEIASQKITVDGAVTEGGVYETQGRTTLLQAVAMAKGATRTANTRNVAVFRNVDGQRTVAKFDLQEIRAGAAEDPLLRGDDIVIVDTSRLNAILRDVISSLPAFALFTAF
jgi:polysaccharide export outer membrane protein